MRLAKLGKKLSEEHVEKLRMASRGTRNPFFGKKHSIKTKEKWSKIRRGRFVGPLSPHWIEDRAKLKTARKQAYDVRYLEWMRAVKNRDGWKCRMSNKECKGRLEAHHIFRWVDFPDLRYEIKNGITLCHHHHPRTREKEVEMSTHFQMLLAMSELL